MKLTKTTITLCAMIGLVGMAFAGKKSTYEFGAKQVNFYGDAYEENEILIEEERDELKFIFTGKDKAPGGKKIQIYCKVWDLKPGEYVLTFEAKSSESRLEFPLSLNGKYSNDDLELTPLSKSTEVEIDKKWVKISLPFKVPEIPTKHGFFIMQVGAVDKKTELYLKREFEIEPK